LKTTIDLPDALFYRAKAVATRRRTTLKSLVIQGLEKTLGEPAEGEPAPLTAEEREFLEIDSYGVPVLSRSKEKRKVVTEDLVNRMREELEKKPG
jgi:hypothetical protein